MQVPRSITAHPADAHPADAHRSRLPVSLALAMVALLAAAPFIAAPAAAQITSPPPHAETRETHPPAHPATHATTPIVRPRGPTHALKPHGAALAKPPPPVAAGVPVPQAAAPSVPATPAKGSVTGFPLPRFVSLRTDEVNLRRGPGTQYPIDWVYKRRDLPVEIEREFEVWRLIVDPNGTRGWVHEATLSGRRSVIVTAKEQILRRDAADTSSAVAKLEPGVIAHLRACAAGADWCQVQVGDYRGYLRRDQFWGVLPSEAVGD